MKRFTPRLTLSIPCFVSIRSHKRAAALLSLDICCFLPTRTPRPSIPRALSCRRLYNSIKPANGFSFSHCSIIPPIQLQKNTWLPQPNLQHPPKINQVYISSKTRESIERGHRSRRLLVRRWASYFFPLIVVAGLHGQRDGISSIPSCSLLASFNTGILLLHCIMRDFIRCFVQEFSFISISNNSLVFSSAGGKGKMS